MAENPDILDVCEKTVGRRRLHRCYCSHFLHNVMVLNSVMGGR